VLPLCWLAWADEIADLISDHGGAKPDRPPAVKALAWNVLRTVIQWRVMRNKGELTFKDGRWIITLRVGLPLEEQAFVIGHELAHWWFKNFCDTVLARDVEEAMCDAVGARLAAPRIPFAAAVNWYGHRVHLLAERFFTLQRVALLRISELTGRPSIIERPGRRIARGRPYDWPEDLWSIPRHKAHPLRVDDGWGMIVNEE